MGQFLNYPKRGRYRASKKGRGDKEAGTEPVKRGGNKEAGTEGQIIGG